VGGYTQKMGTHKRMRETDSNTKLAVTRKKPLLQSAGQLPAFLQSNVAQLQQLLKNDTIISQIRAPTQTGGNKLNLKSLPDLQGSDNIRVNSNPKIRSSKTRKTDENGSKKGKRMGSHITPRAAKRAKNIVVLR
jgi:hypothetical protein